MIFSLEKIEKDRIALLEDDKTRISYGELCQQIESVGRVLQKGSLVFILCGNNSASVIGYLAMLNTGVVPLLLNGRQEKSQIDRLIEKYAPSYIWMPKNLQMQYGYCHSIYELNDYCLVKTDYESPILGDALALLLSTSGSTGSGKLVRISRKNIEANTRAIAAYLDLKADERAITTLPMFYTYGLSVINTHLFVGASIYLTAESCVQQRFWYIFENEKITSLSGVPYTYEILKKIRFMKRQNLSSLRYLTQAGGHMPKDLQKEYGLWAKEKGLDFIIMYGQTEATARMSYLPAGKILEKNGSIGIPIPGGKFELIDDNGKKIETPGVIGELIYYGDNVSLGYATCKEDLIRGDDRKGRLETGDLAKFDEEGFYYIAGRKSRFIKLFGNRVSLDECEEIIRTETGEREIVCGGSDDHLIIYYVNSAARDRIYKAAYEKLQLSERAFELKRIGEIPRMENGKIHYQVLQNPIVLCDSYIDAILANRSPYELAQTEKNEKMGRALRALDDYHRDHCKAYGHMVDAQETLSSPMIPVGLFKRMTLSSISLDTDYKIGTSSGTSSQMVSKIILDGQTRGLQQKALVSIVGDFIGTKRLPLLIMDCEAVVKKREMFSARTSGVQGFSLFGRNRTFALRDDMSFHAEKVRDFLKKYGNEDFLIFGFTYLVWEALSVMVEKESLPFDLSNGILIHGGGWKKLANIGISDHEFKEKLKTATGLSRVYNYYGMAEQSGSIFMECEYGYLHASDFSDIITRKVNDFSTCDIGEKGIIQVNSVLPRSYPGHRLLTEDEGVICGVDDCKCGRKGKYFHILGRLKNAEIRGCSDTYEGK